MSRNKPVCIIGAGFAGLLVARELKRAGIPFRIFEAAPQIGGLSRSFKDLDGFSYDMGTHLITNRLAN